MKNGKIVDKDGNIKYYKNNLLHRDNDLPAVIWTDGTKVWYANGQPHRDNDLPIMIWGDGTRQWYKNGQLHRDNDLPAAVYVDGSKYWYKNGQLHRDNDLPALIFANGLKSYYLKNIHLTYDEYKFIINKKITIKQIEKETNIEKRRLYIEYYGFEKYIKDSDLHLLAKDEYGELYSKVQVANNLSFVGQVVDETIVVVKVKNSTPEHDGTFKHYFIRVPPRFRRPKTAIAWTFGLKRDEYNPLIET